MKCNSRIYFFTGTKKIAFSVPPPYNDASSIIAYNQKHRKNFMSRVDLDNFSKCTGNVRIRVSAEDEPYFGGTSASLNIEYKCDHCGQTNYSGLPDNEHALNVWLNNIL